MILTFLYDNGLTKKKEKQPYNKRRDKLVTTLLTPMT